MMEWTDRHCRFFHRLLTRRALLYSEMVVADAANHGDRERLLGFDASEHPVALQLGGSEPAKLAAAARVGAQFGYDEINLNVGCPSDRVQSGAFGACLMREPALVGECVAAMKEAVDVPVTVKCRLGVDEQDIGPALDRLAQAVWQAGCDRLWVHARKAWLAGLSPKQNREVPPLDYDRVLRLKRENPDRFIGINGGIEDLTQAGELMGQTDGVMLGRAAYRRPALLLQADAMLCGEPAPPISFTELCARMTAYAEVHLAAGGRLNQVTRHMTGLFAGAPGARRARTLLTLEAVKPGAGPEVIERAFAAVDTTGLAAAA